MTNRRDFLTGCGAGAAGVAGGYLFWDYLKGGPLTYPVRTYLNGGCPSYYPGQTSYAESGDDLVIEFLFQHLAERNPKLDLQLKTYLDVGAFHPSINNNTCLFYQKGARGVLVEPNVDMEKDLKRERKEDTVLIAGIGGPDVAEGEVKEEDFYVMNLPMRNTFSKEEAEKIQKESNKAIYIKDVVKVPLYNINDVIAKYFGKAPDFISLDTEGFDIFILKTYNFEKYRPPVFCVETLIAETTKLNQEILDLMKKNGYVARSATNRNTIFVEGKLLNW